MVNLIGSVIFLIASPFGISASPISSGNQDFVTPAIASGTFSDDLKVETITTQPVTMQSMWKWSCPRRGEVTKLFMWQAQIQESVVKTLPLKNIDYFDNLRALGTTFTTDFHLHYCVQRVGFNCVYNVRGTVEGHVHDPALTLDLVKTGYGKTPMVEESCVDTKIPFADGKCPDVRAESFKGCAIHGTDTKAI